MVVVTPEEVRERINVSAAEAPDDVVTRLIVVATATVETETGLTINYSDCISQEAVAIRNLATIYCACRINGGSASGLSFRVGDLQSANPAAITGLIGHHT